MTLSALIVQERGLTLVDASGVAGLRTIGQESAWPTWRPGSASFAVSSISEDSSASLAVVTYPYAEHSQVLARAEPAAFIAPRVPHYAIWSPDGSRLAYVARMGDALGLHVHPAPPAGKPAIEGAPIFTSWTPDSRYILCHVGLSLVVIDPRDGATLQTTASAAAGFRVAAATANGTVAWGTPEAGALGLYQSPVTGEGAARIGVFDGGVALAFRPGSSQLAVGVTRAPQSGVFDELSLVDTNDSSRQLMARGPFTAYWWSPAGDQVAIVAPTQSGDGRLNVRTISPAGDVLATSEAFVPSQDFRFMLGFFDQYRLSHPAWLPDGSGLLLAGRRADDAVHGTLGDPVGDYVMLWRAQRGAPLEPLAPGRLGVARPDPLDEAAEG